MVFRTCEFCKDTKTCMLCTLCRQACCHSCKSEDYSNTCEEPVCKDCNKH